MTKRLRLFLPLLVILGAAIAAAVMVRAKPTVQRVEREIQPPLVRVVAVEPGPVTLSVRSGGTVEPKSRSTLVAQIGARVAALSRDFAEGAFFNRGQVLLELDPSDFELTVTQAQARVAQATVQLEREQAERRMAIEEWGELGTGDPGALVLREPQLAQARAEVKAAQAALDLASLQLERTKIRAPFAGRVEAKFVDVGQFVGPGSRLAEVYSTSQAEIALEIPQKELAFLEISLGKPTGDQPRALLDGMIGSTQTAWPARIVRTGSRIDPKTRMISVIAEIDDPFSLSGTHVAPLPMGIYVEASIEGTTVAQAVTLPRAVLRDDDRVLVVTPDDRIDIREVDILRRTGNEIVVTGGLERGERVSLSPLTAVVDGMRVRTVGEDEVPEVPEATTAPGDLS